MRLASSSPLAKPSPSSTRYCDSPMVWPSSADSVRAVNIMSIIRAVPLKGGSRTEPPPTTAPCNTATTGTLPNSMRSKARCQERECAMPATVARSTSSVRSRPALKCSPSPHKTTAPISSGSVEKKVSMPATIGSSSALRFCARLSRNTATAPWRSVLSEGGSSDQDILFRYQRAAALIEWSERLLGRNRCRHFEHIPLVLGFVGGLDLQQIHGMDRAPVRPDHNVAKQRIVVRALLHRGNDGAAVGR